MTNNKILEKFIQQVQASSIKKANKHHKIRVVKEYVCFLNKYGIFVNEVSIQHIEMFIGTKSHLKASSLNMELAHLRTFYECLQQRGLVTKNMRKLIKFRTVPRQLPKNISKAMMLRLCEPTAEELEQKTTTKILRNQAILEFLFSTGVRNGELRTARLKQLTPDLKQCLINTSKSGPVRTVFLGKYARASLHLYLRRKKIDITNLANWQKEMTIFTGVRGKPLQSSALTRIVKKLAIERIGCPVTPHMIRHTFATEMLKATDCLRSVQVMMGHAKISSTVQYCHLNTADKKKAILNYHPRSKVDKNK